METITETFRIKGRGVVAIFKLEHVINVGDHVRRVSDGATWIVSGIECMGRPPRPGEIASVLFDSRGAEPQAGDEFDRL